MPTIKEQKERFLLYRIRVHGERKSFAVLHDLHVSRIYRFLRAKLPTREDADDAVSTTFLRLWNYLLVSEVESVSGLVFTIARSVVAEFYRSRRETVSYDEHPEVAEALSDAGRGEKRIEAQANVSLVRDLLAELPDEQALAVNLRFVEGLPMAEIAERIGKTTNATQVMLHRSLKALRNKMEPPPAEKDR